MIRHHCFCDNFYIKCLNLDFSWTAASKESEKTSEVYRCDCILFPTQAGLYLCSQWRRFNTWWENSMKLLTLLKVFSDLSLWHLYFSCWIYWLLYLLLKSVCCTQYSVFWKVAWRQRSFLSDGEFGRYIVSLFKVKGPPPWFCNIGQRMNGIWGNSG